MGWGGRGGCVLLYKKEEGFNFKRVHPSARLSISMHACGGTALVVVIVDQPYIYTHTYMNTHRNFAKGSSSALCLSSAALVIPTTVSMGASCCKAMSYRTYFVGLNHQQRHAERGVCLCLSRGNLSLYMYEMDHLLKFNTSFFTSEKRPRGTNLQGAAGTALRWRRDYI